MSESETGRQPLLAEYMTGYWLKPRPKRNPHQPHKNHLKCPCGKPVGHGRHYYGVSPEYWCECGFHASRRDELERHLQTGKGRLPGKKTELM